MQLWLKKSIFLSFVLLATLFSVCASSSSSFFTPSSSLKTKPTSRTSTLPGSKIQDGNQFASNYQERTFTDFTTRDSRLGFIRRVFAIFNVQILATISIVATILNNPSIANMLLRNRQAISLVTGLGSLGVIFALSFSQTLRHEAPLNYILLGIHTVLQSVGLGLFASFFNPKQVLIGAMHTLFAFTAITLYSFQPNQKYDLNVMGNLLLTASIASVGGALMNYFIGNIPLLDNVLLGVGAVVASSYIYYDTKMIVGGKHATKKYGQKEHILAAMNLYQDAINLFIRIMKILAKLEERKGRQNESKRRRKNDREFGWDDL